MSELAEVKTHPVAEDITSAIQDSTPDELTGLSPEEFATAQKIMPAIVAQANRTATAAHAKAIEREVTELKASNERMINTEIEKFRAQNKPLEPADITKLLSQEYAEFAVTVKDRRPDKDPRVFMIRELPQAVEKKIMAIIQKTLVPHLKEFSSVEWTSAATVAEKMQRVIDVVPGALDTLSQVAQIALDPYGEESVTVEWVQNNLSSFRIAAIVEAQLLTSKVRDFFLAASRFIPT